MPDILTTDYHSGLADPNLPSMDDELAVIDAFSIKLLEEIKEGQPNTQPAGLWRQLEVSVAEVTQALVTGDTPGINKALAKLRAVIKSGKSQAQHVAQLMGNFERRRKMAATENIRRKIDQDYVLQIEALAIFVAMRSAFERRALEMLETKLARSLLHAVAQDLDSIVEGGGR